MKTRARKLFGKIESSRSLPSLPHILVRLIEACNREEVTIKEISQIIKKDGSLSARLMRLVNSIYYGLPNTVTGVDHALFLSGTDAVKNVTISASVFQAFDQTKESSVFGLKCSGGYATLAKLIAEKTSYAACDEAFLSGLLHDIGKLVLLGLFPKGYAEILQSHMGKTDLLLAGETRLGATHC